MTFWLLVYAVCGLAMAADLDTYCDRRGRCLERSMRVAVLVLVAFTWPFSALVMLALIDNED